MKQKVFVQGREAQPVWLKQEYVRSKKRKNSFSEINFSQFDFSQTNTAEKTHHNGYQVRRIGNRDPFANGDAWKNTH